MARAVLATDPQNANLADVCADLDRLSAKAAEQRFQIAVVALVKSGKSTLINALLGDDLLPVSNVPETARIVRVRHTPGETAGCLRNPDGVVARGRSEIAAHLRALNAELRRSAHAPARGDPNDELLLEAPLAALQGRAAGGQPFEVLDTPGPNEAGTEVMRAKVDRLLGEADVVLYLLDYTKLRTEEERGVFERLSELRPELLNQLSDRLFFAVNKMDQENSDGLSPTETRLYVAQLLQTQLPGLRVDPGRVLLVSSEQARLARLVESGRAGLGSLRDFARICFGLRGQNQATLDDCRPHAAAVLRSSRLLDLEDRVVSFLYQQRGRIVLQALLDGLERALANLDNHLRTDLRASQLEHGRLSERMRSLTAELRQTDQAFVTVDALASDTADLIEAWARRCFSSFSQAVEAELGRAWGAPAADVPEPGDDRLLRRPRAWRSLADTLAAHEAEPEATDETAAARGVAHVQRAVAAQLRAEFTLFLGELELAAWERQRALFAAIEERVAPLAALVSEVVSQRLDIDLRPVRLEIPAPSFDDLQRDIELQVGRFVERRTRLERSQEARRVLARKGGWCSEDEYQKRMVGVTRSVTVFAVGRDELLASWRRWIREHTEVSVETAAAIIRERVGAAAAQARARLDGYRDGYLRAVRRTLPESSRGEEERRERLRQIEAGRARLHDMQLRLARCREFVATMEPA